MKYLLCLLIVILALGIWVGPVRSLKIRHYCNYQALAWSSKHYGDVTYAYADYNYVYQTCLRGR